MRILLITFCAVLSACTTNQPITPNYPPGVKDAPKALVDDEGRPARLLESFSSDSIAIMFAGTDSWKIVSKTAPINVPIKQIRELTEFGTAYYAVKNGNFWVVFKKS